MGYSLITITFLGMLIAQLAVIIPTTAKCLRSCKLKLLQRKQNKAIKKYQMFVLEQEEAFQQIEQERQQEGQQGKKKKKKRKVKRKQKQSNPEQEEEKKEELVVSNNLENKSSFAQVQNDITMNTTNLKVHGDGTIEEDIVPAADYGLNYDPDKDNQQQIENEQPLRKRPPVALQNLGGDFFQQKEELQKQKDLFGFFGQNQMAKVQKDRQILKEYTAAFSHLKSETKANENTKQDINML